MKLVRKPYLILFACISLLFSACEDVIDVDLTEGRSQLVVDGFLTNDSSIQTIRLTRTANFFSNAPTPPFNGADVKVIGPGGQVFNFTSDGNGNYRYDPLTAGAIDSVGFNYRLELVYNGDNYIATSILNPVPVIDSMTYAFEEESIGNEEGYFAQFFARDFAGRKDFYWIRGLKNGTYINAAEPSSLVLAEDASFGGEGADGFVFITPLRGSITSSDDPLQIGDVAGVELMSINKEVFNFLQQLTTQANNGGLFSTPPANIRPNIFDAAGQIQEEVLGVFSVSSVSRSQVLIQ
tara:strand:- start:1036 stop:1917 length:882 start_codon:yes stop_codon:yes gene_type:complete